MPAQIVVIRHGEKPATGGELSAQGVQRAQSLPRFFKTNPEVMRFGAPVAIYAFKPAVAGGSVRAIQTVTPLAKQLGLSIHQDYIRDDYAKMVEEIKSTHAYDGHMVLICWEHKVITDIVAAFGATGHDWPGGDVYDRAWVLDFNGDQLIQFKDLPESLLPGDSPTYAF